TVFCQTSSSAESKALFNEGLVLYNQENYIEAIAKFEKAVKSGDKRAETYFQIGLCYKRLLRITESIRYFSKASGLDSSFSEAYGYRAYAYFDTENYKRALADFNEVIKLDTANICLYLHRGLSKYMLKNYSGAIEDYEHLLARKSQFSEAEVTLFYFFKAEAEYCDRTDVDNEIFAYMSFQGVVDRDSTFAEAYLYLGYICHNFSDEETIEYMDKYLSLDSSNDEALYLRGSSKFFLGIDDMGEADLRESASLGNKDAKFMLKKEF
ncbi:MAG: tetratricopeptide repeat protein, partial [Cryomorphaceae bacterium]